MQPFDIALSESNSEGLLQTTKPESILNLVDRACALETIGYNFKRLSNEKISLETLRLGYNAVHAADSSALDGIGSVAVEEESKISKALELTKTVYDAIGRMYESISNNLTALASFIAKRIRHFNLDIDAIRNKAFRLKDEIKALKRKTPSFPTVKPEFKFLYLCDSRGFSSDLKTVCKSTKDLVASHRLVLKNINENERSWLSQDLPRSLSDFDAWSFNKDNVTLKDSNDMGGQWNGQKAKQGCTLFANQDLFGCRDFLTQTSIIPKTAGAEVIDRLERLDYGFVQNRFYRAAATALTDYSKLSTAQWKKISLESGYGKNTDLDISKEIETLDAAGVRCNAKIDKRFAFESLSIPKMQEAINETIALCDELVSWSECAYKDTWKTDLIDSAFDQLRNDNTQDQNLQQIRRLIKSRCAAFIDLSRRYHGSMDNHAFKVADACLAFVEKNMRLYEEETITL